MTIRNEYSTIINEVIILEHRKSKLIIGKPGGTAAKNSKTYKISIPSTWVNEMGLDDEHRDVELSFNEGTIYISPVLSLDEYVSKKLKQKHTLYKISFYDKHELCTLIYADFTDCTIKVEQCTSNTIKTAFGNNPVPSWESFQEFLEERCIPRGRDGLREYLESIGIDEYDPFEIIKKTEGRMAEDCQWIKTEKIL